MVQSDIGGSEVVGVVEEALPNAQFRVRIEQGSLVLAYLSGKMVLNRIKVLIGDRVIVKLDPYGQKGRVIKRL